MSILVNELRIGNFTSSEIFKLMSDGRKTGEPGKPFFEYIDEKKMERRLMRSIKTESDAKPLVWGKLCEYIVFDKLGSEYYPISDKTIAHPTITNWTGSPDTDKFEGEIQIVGDIKCPLTLKSFCQLVDGNSIESVRDNHKDGEKYYWQLVSNAILTCSKFAELIVFCPYKSELDSIREMATEYWIVNGTDEELPWLHENGHYKNLNIIRFEVTESDKKALTDRVLLAIEYLKS